MRSVRGVEFASGVLAGVLGLVALAVVLFAPLNESCTSTTGGSGGTTQACQRVSYVAANGIMSVLPVVTVFSLIFLAIVLGTILHTRFGLGSGRVILWLATALLVVGNIFTILSIGPFLILSTLLALCASIFAVVRPTGAAPASS